MSLLEQNQAHAEVPNIGGRSLFDGEKRATVTPEELDVLNARVYGYEGSRRDAEAHQLDESVETYWEQERELMASINEARRKHRVYDIQASKNVETGFKTSNAERVQTMARAVGRYGLQAAEKYGITKHRVETTSRLFTHFIGGDDSELTLDEGAFITTALSLKEMESSNASDPAEEEAAGEARRLLLEVQQASGRTPEADDVGSDTGELALAAIANHHHPRQS